MDDVNLDFQDLLLAQGAFDEKDKQEYEEFLDEETSNELPQ